MEFFGREQYGRGEAAARKLFEGAVVLTPGVSFANLGQLTIDLLINSLLAHKDVYMKLVGHLFTKRVLPMAGSSAFATQSPSDLCLNLEVYLLSLPTADHPEVQKIVFVQQRTSVIPGQVQTFCDEFAAWAKSCHASQVVVLSGVDSMLRHDPNMQMHRIEWTSTSTDAMTNNDFLKQIPSLKCDETTDDVWSSVRGAGLAPFVMQSCKESLPGLAFVMYCAEGNNVPDAVYMASCVAQYLYLQRIAAFKLVLPPSWSQVFGRDPTPALYS
ncbi:unnamed protein product [Aphanomyces euteiches]